MNFCLNLLKVNVNLFLSPADFFDNTLSYLPYCLGSEPRATLVSVDQGSVGSHCFPLRLNLQNREKRDNPLMTSLTLTP